MKTYCCLILIAFSAFSCLNRQDPANDIGSQVSKHISKSVAFFKGDTLQYLRFNFIDQKKFFVHKEIKVILSHLEPPIVTFTPIIGGGGDVSNYIAVYMMIDKASVIEHKFDRKINPGILVVYFDKYVPVDTLLPLLKRANGIWTKEVNDHLGSIKIRDIKMMNIDPLMPVQASTLERLPK